MDLHRRAASLSHDEIVSLLEQQSRSEARITELQHQLDWFKRQLFGSRSERRLLPESPHQLSLGEVADTPATADAPASTPVKAHRRRAGRQRPEEAVTDSGLRFDESVPVEEIRIEDPEIAAMDPSEYEVIDQKTTYRLAQRPSSYLVLRYVRDVVRRKDNRQIVCPPAPPAIFDRSYADVSLLVNLAIDKFCYHMPLHRQHQRLRAAGIQIDRSTLTHLLHRTAHLLSPIFNAQMTSILSSEVLAMDETPIRAGRKGKGKMKRGYFWPVYGDKDEVAFPFADTRARSVIQEVLGKYCGVLLSDGYQAYDRYARSLDKVIHAQCWAHTRRKFVEAQEVEPELVSQVLDLIARLYQVEHEIDERQLSGEAKLMHRSAQSRPLVEDFFGLLHQALQERLLLPSSPFTKAAAYAIQRTDALKVFFEYPDVPLDTNHLERAIRVIAVGRKNWLFCWTEAGAHVVAILQSLLATCRLQGVDPYTYLVDVLQRIDFHPANDVAALTPRLWKERFAQAPLPSDVDVWKRAHSDLSRAS